MDSVPLTLRNRQRRIKASWATITAQAIRAAEHVAASHPEAFAHIEQIEVTVLSDAQIARIHAKFLDDPTPTDVITFHHGEILLGAETIADNAARHGTTLDDELLLCIIHGCLHLAGYLDASPRDFRRMKAEQERILKWLLANHFAKVPA